MKKSILLILFSILTIASKAQVSVGYFPFQSFLSISSNSDKRIWAEYKIQTNTFASNLNMEISPKYNWMMKKSHSYYIGPGLSFNPFNPTSDLSLVNGYFIDFGTRIKPIEKIQKLNLVFELSPYANKEFTGGNLRARLGISWNF